MGRPKPENLVVKLVETDEERQSAFAIRMRVFVQEQAVPAEKELDENDYLPLAPDLVFEDPHLLSGPYDAQGKQASHAIALVVGKPIGTGRVVYHCSPPAADQSSEDRKALIRVKRGDARIGRMAVDMAWRRRGIGSRILRILEEEAARRGMAEAVLHAQTYVKDFYAAHGYVEDGDVFLEVEIEHVQMRKRL